MPFIQSGQSVSRVRLSVGGNVVVGGIIEVVKGIEKEMDKLPCPSDPVTEREVDMLTVMLMDSLTLSVLLSVPDSDREGDREAVFCVLVREAEGLSVFLDRDRDLEMVRTCELVGPKETVSTADLVSVHVFPVLVSVGILDAVPE